MLVLGVVLLAASLFIIEALRRAYGAPQSGKWTASDTLGNLIAVAITAMVGIGGTTSVFGAIAVVTGEASWIQAVIAILVIAGAVGLLMVRRRARTSHPRVPLAHA